MTPLRVLAIEDEPPIRKFLKSALEAEGYIFEEAESAAKGLRQATQLPPDLVLLDLGLPDRDGQEVLKELRGWFTAPILILSARDQEAQKVSALDSGADDYLTKPFGTGELLARIRAALRRRRPEADEPVFEMPGLKVDLAARRVFAGEAEAKLTPIEFKLLATLVQHVGKVLTHRFLLKEVWGPNQVFDMHTLRVHMANLRRKIDPAGAGFLKTETGVGYRLVDAESM